MDHLQRSAKEIQREMEKLYISKDFKAMSEHYTENCKLYMQGNDEPYCGRDGVLRALGCFHNYGVAKVTTTQDELIYGGGDTALQIGRFTCFDHNGVSMADGKFQLLLKRIGGQWFCHRDMSNMDEFDVAGQLRECFKKWNTLFSAGDYNRLVTEMYTDDCKISLPGKPMVCGKKAVLATMKEMMVAQPDHAKGRAEQRQGEVFKISDNVAAEVDSKFCMRDCHGQIIDKGRYMAIWKKVGGCWRLHSDMMNSIENCPEHGHQ